MCLPVIVSLSPGRSVSCVGVLNSSDNAIGVLIDRRFIHMHVMQDLLLVVVVVVVVKQ